MKRTKIDWTEVVWNPITGCTGPDGDGEHCWYCYAKRQAPRFAGRFGYPAEDPFRPTFHPNRLSEPAAEKTPRTVFVGSMGDTFGPAVEPDWIAQVGGAMAAAPQHRYLLLTRHPRRYTLLPPPQPDVEVWYGTTLTDHTLENDHRLDDLLEFGGGAPRHAATRAPRTPPPSACRRWSGCRRCPRTPRAPARALRHRADRVKASRELKRTGRHSNVGGTTRAQRGISRAAAKNTAV